MSAEDLRGKPQIEAQEVDLKLIQAYRQRILTPVATIIATTQELGLFGKGWYRTLEEKRGKNFSVSGSFIPAESFELWTKTNRSISDSFPLKSVRIKTGMRRSQERHGVLNLGRTTEVNPEGKISLSLYRDPAKRIIIDSPDKLQFNITVSDDLPEGDRLSYKIDYQYWVAHSPFLNLTSRSLPSFEISYTNRSGRSHPYLLEPDEFIFKAEGGNHSSIPPGLNEQDLKTFIIDQAMKSVGRIQESIPPLASQFPLTFDAKSFAETTLGELEKELTALNSDLRAHFPAQHHPIINITI